MQVDGRRCGYGGNRGGGRCCYRSGCRGHGGRGHRNRCCQRDGLCSHNGRHGHRCNRSSSHLDGWSHELGSCTRLAGEARKRCNRGLHGPRVGTVALGHGLLEGGVRCGVLALRLLPRGQPASGEGGVRVCGHGGLHRWQCGSQLPRGSRGRGSSGSWGRGGCRRGRRLYHGCQGGRRLYRRLRRVGFGQIRGPTLRWVDLSVVGTAQRHSQLGLLAGRDVFRLGVAIPQSGKVEGHAGSNQLGQAANQRLHPIAAPPIQGDGLVVLSLQHPANQAGQYCTRAHLDKGVRSALGHVLDQVHETDGAADLLGEARASLIGAPCVRCSHLAGPDRQLCFIEGDIGEKGAEGGGALRDEGGVKGRAHLQATVGQVLGLQRLLGSIDPLAGPGNHHFLGGVVVGDHHVGATQVL